MSLLSLAGLATATLVLAASPGPGVFATVARSLASGFRSALEMIAGIVTGDLIYLMFAVFGLSAAARMFGEWFVVVKIGGGVYLIWIGAKIFFSKPSEEQKNGAVIKRARSENFISGLLITLSNPKVILFYCGFLPAFTDLTVLSGDEVILISGVIATVLASVLAVCAYAASRARRLLSGAKAAGRLNRTAGCVMMAAGVALAAEA